jgi:putative redox protein
MSVEITMTYEGSLRCRAVHGPSGKTLQTDAPVDNMGRGESFSPTDLVATALGTCIATTMAIVAQREGLDLAGMRVKVVKEMITQPSRRIGELTTLIHVPAKLTAEQRQKLENAAHACPVHKSLHPDVKLPITFEWGESVDGR